MKKPTILTIICVIFLLMFTLPSKASAENEEIIFSLSSAMGTQGENLTVTLSLEKGKICGFENLRIYFNNEYILITNIFTP